MIQINLVSKAGRFDDRVREDLRDLKDSRLSDLSKSQLSGSMQFSLAEKTVYPLVLLIAGDCCVGSLVTRSVCVFTGREVVGH